MDDQNIWSLYYELCDWWMAIKIYSMLTVGATVILSQVWPSAKKVISKFQNVLACSIHIVIFLYLKQKCQFSPLYEGPSPICVIAGNVLTDGRLGREFNEQQCSQSIWLMTHFHIQSVSKVSLFSSAKKGLLRWRAQRASVSSQQCAAKTSQSLTDCQD